MAAEVKMQRQRKKATARFWRAETTALLAHT
jgi:hypothetical protein